MRPCIGLTARGPFMAPRVISPPRINSVAFRAKRTSTGGQDRLDRSRMTRSRHLELEPALWLLSPPLTKVAPIGMVYSFDFCVVPSGGRTT